MYVSKHVQDHYNRCDEGEREWQRLESSVHGIVEYEVTLHILTKHLPNERGLDKIRANPEALEMLLHQAVLHQVRSCRHGPAPNRCGHHTCSLGPVLENLKQLTGIPGMTGWDWDDKRRPSVVGRKRAEDRAPALRTSAELRKGR